MSDETLERRLREQGERLPLPHADVTVRARDAAAAALVTAESERLGELARGHRRRAVPLARRAALVRPLAVGAGAAALVVFGFGIGLFVAPSTGANQGVSVGFLPAIGWNTVATGAVPVTEGPTAIASTAPIITEDGPIGTFPRRTLERFSADDVLIFATVGARGENAGVDARYAPRDLPLTLADAEILRRWETQPRENVPLYRLTAAIGQLNVSVHVYFGTVRPAPELQAAADEQLARLTLPEGS
ncbi:MAG: hypothetical protein ICV64_10705 [Thermoleophilia bacterium]|nr:hypothetical protein [Thermoleophilia bacterium]